MNSLLDSFQMHSSRKFTCLWTNNSVQFVELANKRDEYTLTSFSFTGHGDRPDLGCSNATWSWALRLSPRSTLCFEKWPLYETNNTLGTKFETIHRIRDRIPSSFDSSFAHELGDKTLKLDFQLICNKLIAEFY